MKTRNSFLWLWKKSLCYNSARKNNYEDWIGVHKTSNFLRESPEIGIQDLGG